jgi:hypothetical protein
MTRPLPQQDNKVQQRKLQTSMSPVNYF